MTFQILFLVGVLFIILQSIVSFYLNNIGPKTLISEESMQRNSCSKESILFNPLLSFSDLVSVVIIELDWHCIFDRILLGCYCNCCVYKLFGVRIDCECHFGEFIHNEYSGDGNVLHFHVWTIGRFCWQQCGRINAGKLLHNHFLCLRSTFDSLYRCFRNG